VVDVDVVVVGVVVVDVDVVVVVVVVGAVTSSVLGDDVDPTIRASLLTNRASYECAPSATEVSSKPAVPASTATVPTSVPSRRNWTVPAGVTDPAGVTEILARSATSPPTVTLSGTSSAVTLTAWIVIPFDPLTSDDCDGPKWSVAGSELGASPA
jgi:hypothetical protein